MQPNLDMLLSFVRDELHPAGAQGITQLLVHLSQLSWVDVLLIGGIMGV